MPNFCLLPTVRANSDLDQISTSCAHSHCCFGADRNEKRWVVRDQFRGPPVPCACPVGSAQPRCRYPNKDIMLSEGCKRGSQKSGRGMNELKRSTMQPTAHASPTVCVRCGGSSSVFSRQRAGPSCTHDTGAHTGASTVDGCRTGANSFDSKVGCSLRSFRAPAAADRSQDAPLTASDHLKHCWAVKKGMTGCEGSQPKLDSVRTRHCANARSNDLAQVLFKSPRALHIDPLKLSTI